MFKLVYFPEKTPSYLEVTYSDKENFKRYKKAIEVWCSRLMPKTRPRFIEKKDSQILELYSSKLVNFFIKQLPKEVKNIFVSRGGAEKSIEADALLKKLTVKYTEKLEERTASHSVYVKEEELKILKKAFKAPGTTTQLQLVEYGGIQYYIKNCLSMEPGSKSLIFEAANTCLAGLIAGHDRVPTVYNIYDKSKQRKGLLVENIFGAKTVQSFLVKHEKINKIRDKKSTFFCTNYKTNKSYNKKSVKKLIDAGLIPLYVTSLFVGDIESYFENFRFKKDGMLCRINFEKASFGCKEMQEKYLLHTKTLYAEKGFKGPAMMALSASDIGVNFFAPKKMLIPRWFHHAGIEWDGTLPEFKHPDFAKKCSKIPAAFKDQYRTLLKIALIPEQDIMLIATAYIDSKKSRKSFIEYYKERLNDWREKIINHKKITNFISSNPGIFDLISADFKSFYEHLPKQMALTKDEINNRLTLFTKNKESLLFSETKHTPAI